MIIAGYTVENPHHMMADIDKVMAVIDTEDKWAWGRYAFDADGIPSNPNFDRACCWCLFGAIRKAFNFDYDQFASAPVSQYLELVLWNRFPEWYSRPLSVFNDNAAIEYKHVIALLQYARDLVAYEVAVAEAA